MARVEQHAWASVGLSCTLLIMAIGCGDDTDPGPDGSLPEDGGMDAQADAHVDASMDATVDADVDATVDADVDATVDADVDASDGDAGPECVKTESTIFGWPGDPELGEPPTPHEATQVKMDALCSEHCPVDFASALEDIQNHASDAGTWCPYSRVSGCGFEVLVELWSAHHFDAETGELLGVERLRDVGYELAGCRDALFVAGDRIPECPERTKTSLCSLDDGGMGPDGSTPDDAGTDGGA